MKLKIFLTGGRGMVGKNFLKLPNIKKFQILSPSSKELDLRNYNKTKKFLNFHKPDIIIHAAGIVGGIQANINYPLKFLIDNLEIGKNIVTASKETNIKKLINLGSSCMYPANYNKPLTEDLILKGALEPTNEGYALAKIVTARLCQYINHDNKKFNYKTIIPCNLYGKYDNFDPLRSHLIPAIIHKVHTAKKTNKKNVEIWGDGLSRREFMYAGDFADALLHAILNFNSLPDIINIGLGHDYSIKQYYLYAAKVIGYKGNFVYDKSKPTGMKRKLVSISKQKKWGWSYKTDLQDGIKKTYEYYLRKFGE